MTTRVLSTDEAKTTITQMKALLEGGLESTLQQLKTQGSTLSDPNVWDGTKAVEFRSYWQETATKLDAVKAARGAQEVHACDLRQGAHALRELRLEITGVPGEARAHIELRREHRIQPFVQRSAEGRHHDRHGRHEREAGDDGR